MLKIKGVVVGEYYLANIREIGGREEREKCRIGVCVATLVFA